MGAADHVRKEDLHTGSAASEGPGQGGFDRFWNAGTGDGVTGGMPVWIWNTKKG